MAYSKKPMSDLEKKAKLSVLKDAHSMASNAMKDSYTRYKDSPELKKHTKMMSEDAGMDLKNDSDHIMDPGMDGDVVGRHISDENEDHCDTPSTYDEPDIEARLKILMEKKAQIMKGKK